MTQSKERRDKFPLPPLPRTSPQINTYIDDEDDGPDEEHTQLNTSGVLPPLGKKLGAGSGKSSSPPDLDLDNFDDLDDFEGDDDDDDNVTSVTAKTPTLQGKARTAPPPLPSTETAPPARIPPQQQKIPASRTGTVAKQSEDVTEIRTPGNLPLPGSRAGAAARMTSPSARAGETDVRRAPGQPPQRPGPLPQPGSPSGYSIPNVGRSPGQPLLADLIKLAFDAGYSDVHLGVGEKVRMRDRGEMIILEQYPEIDLNTFMSWLREIMTEDQIQKFKKELEFDGATQYDFARVRINVFDSLRGPALVLRLIPLKILTVEQLRLPPVFKDVSDAHKGLVLVTGPTGSGKSTTLAAMVDYINTEHPKHIITIEDPVEFVHNSRRALIKQREVGMHTLFFDNALKAALREDPDIILVGEMRDKGTVNTALKAAQTGHLVMGTLHTNSAIKTLERILTLYTAEEQPAMRSAIAESLVAIIAQGLCRTTDGKRAAYHDILINTEAIKDYIREGKYDEIAPLMADGEFDGMITMNKSLFNLYQEGRITEEVALENSPTRNEMAMMLRGRV
jgi:twitching motility protein PilT